MKKRFRIEDCYGIDSLGDPQISPDGRRVAYVLGRDDVGENHHVSDVHISDVETRASYKLTAGPRRDDTPRWSPDSQRIAFLSDRPWKKPDPANDEQPAQIWLIRVDGGEAERLTDTGTEVESFRWAPGGDAIAYLAPDPLTDEEEKQKKDKNDARVVDHDLKTSHLWILDLKDRKRRRLTRGRYHVRGFSWSPNGRRIVFHYSPSPRADDMWFSDIAVVPVSGGRRKIVVKGLGASTKPVWSPDGKHIAFVSSEGTTDRLANDQLWVVPGGGGAPRNLTPKEEDLSGIHAWSPDSRFIYCGVQRGVSGLLCRVSRSGGRIRMLTSNKVVGDSVTLSDSGRLAAMRIESGSRSAQVYVTPLPDVEPGQVTDLNPHLRDYRVARKEIVRWKSSDGLEIEGILIKPPGYRRGRRVPMLTVVHGGPTGAFMYTFDPGGPRVYPLAVFANRGYAVLLPNPRGSVGYGEAFRKANYRDWGGGVFKDIMSGVDAMVARGIANPNRLGLLGWSYGGYMAAWAVTQTDRFQAASMGAGITNLYSMYGSHDIQSYLRAFFGNYPWRDPEEYARHSAMTFVDQVKTPVLIQHGEQDTRVPLSQAKEFYQALRDRGATVEFVVYPRQGHGVSEPKLMRDVMQRNVDWMDRWVLGKRVRKAK